MTGDQPLRVIGVDEVVKRTDLSRTTIWRLVGKGSFPKPLKLTQRRIAWPEAEVDAWLSGRMGEPRGAEAST